MDKLAKIAYDYFKKVRDFKEKSNYELFSLPIGEIVSNISEEMLSAIKDRGTNPLSFESLMNSFKSNLVIETYLKKVDYFTKN